jgi:Leucine-rich repeat (LRR) protein
MEKKDDLNKEKKILSYIFPFLNNNNENNEKLKNLTNNEYKTIVSKIQDKNSDLENFLTGEENILDSLILKYSPNLKKSEIKNLKNLTLKIPENFGMLNDIGFYLKNLIYLNLEGSFLKSIEEIGISFKNLEILIVKNCLISDLTGIVCFVNLKEFDAGFNKIKDLFELEMCNSINILKLNDNEIENEENFEFLINLTNLKELNIKNNLFVKYINNWKFNNDIKIDY